MTVKDRNRKGKSLIKVGRDRNIKNGQHVHHFCENSLQVLIMNVKVFKGTRQPCQCVWLCTKQRLLIGKENKNGILYEGILIENVNEVVLVFIVNFEHISHLFLCFYF